MVLVLRLRYALGVSVLFTLQSVAVFGSSQEELEEEEEIEDVYVPYTPPVAKPWQSLGSEVEIDEETVRESRKKVRVW